MTTPIPRHTCPVCKRSIPLRKNGALGKHETSRAGEHCPASGMTPGDAREWMNRQETTK